LLAFLAVFVDEKYEGLGMGYLEQCLVNEEFARLDLSIAQSIESTFFGTQLFPTTGLEEQKRQYLPALCSGEIRTGEAFRTIYYDVYLLMIPQIRFWISL
jgi:alkylation response protein AidB-like acyl-CoA dehydrogenase